MALVKIPLSWITMLNVLLLFIMLVGSLSIPGELLMDEAEFIEEDDRKVCLVITSVSANFSSFQQLANASTRRSFSTQQDSAEDFSVSANDLDKPRVLMGYNMKIDQSALNK